MWFESSRSLLKDSWIGTPSCNLWAADTPLPFWEDSSLSSRALGFGKRPEQDSQVQRKNPDTTSRSP